jgi:hypothetical protein
MAISDITASSGTLLDPVSGAIEAAASATGVDFSFLFQQAKIESGLNTQAKAGTSSASGLFQFTRDTWMKVVEQHGDSMGLANEAASLKNGSTSPADRQRILDMRNNPEISARLAANYAIDNARALQAQGHKVTGPTDLYLAHFLGSGGAAKFLDGMKQNPNASAADILPSAANANKTIFYKNGEAASFADIYQRFAKHFDAATPATQKSVAVAALALADKVTPDRATTVTALTQRLKAPETLAKSLSKAPEKALLPGITAQPKQLQLQQPQQQQPQIMALATRKPFTAKAPAMPAAPVVAPTPAPSATEDAAPVSVDSLAKFLDTASKWTADPGKMHEQAQKGVASRDASEGLQQRSI